MRLRQLRKHYTRKNKMWVPKAAFDSLDDIRKKTGFDPNKCNVYECDICPKLHIASHPLESQ